jgi:hypothetical protein
MICARLLKEREEKIREEYDQILSNKLNGKKKTTDCFFLYKEIFCFSRAI